MKKHISIMVTAIVAATVLAECGTSEGAAPIGAPTTAPTEVATTAAETETETTTAEAEAATEAAQAAGEETEVLMAAAASLKNAYEEELIPMFQGKYPGVTIEGTYDSLGRLQTQVEEGLEADVFMSATTKQMTTLDEEEMIASDTITNLLENKIVLIVPTGSDPKLAKFEDIENAESITLGNLASISTGQYTGEALTNLGIWDKIQDNINLGTNVTEALSQVAVVGADAGIVYTIDAASMADKVEVVAEAPEGSPAKKVVYPVAVVKNTAHEEQTKNFVEFLKTDETTKAFEACGFTKGE